MRVGARWCALATTAFVTLSVGSGHANRACSNRIFAGCLRSATPPLRPCCAMLQRLDVFGAGNVESVAFQQSLFRINDAGLADTQWRLPADFQITEQYLAPDGAPIVRAYVRNSPTYEQRWYRLRAETLDQITPVEISSVSDLPPGTRTSKSTAMSFQRFAWCATAS